MTIDSFAKYLIVNGKKFGTSDIHVLPVDQEYHIYFRLGGIMNKQYSLTFEKGERLISYFKYSANMDIGERRRPQSGALLFQISEKETQDLRFSTITNFRDQESLVIRLLEIQKKITLEKSTFLLEELNQIKKTIQFRSGLILFSGPVNSGKTTTMYELIRERLDKEKLHVIAIEDPVEITEENFFQVQVNNRAGNSYEESLKACLRHHPDVVIVGEIRDEETAKMAVRGALTGHLIVASVHAKNAEGVLARLVELGISYEMLQQTLIGIVFQKLLPLYCGICKGNCQVHCSKYPVFQKRGVLYDYLNRKEIEKIKDVNQLGSDRNRNFNHLLEKVYMYGFISEETFNQYYIP